MINKTERNIPERWSDKKLGDCLNKIYGGGTPSKDNPSYWNGHIPWASVKDIVNRNLNNTIDHITELGIKKSSTRLIKKGTLIVPTRMALGHAMFFNVDVAINQDLKALYPKQNLKNEFLFYWFQQKREYIKRIGSGSTVSGISQNDLRNLRFLLPPLSEQNHIVTVLDVWNKTIEKLSRKIELKKKIKRGLMQKLLTGEVRLNSRYDERKITYIGKICEVRRGGSPRPIQNYLTKEENGLNWLRIGDVNIDSKYIYNTKEKIKLEGLHKTALVNDGDFILSNSMSFGRPYIMRTNACIHDGWLTLKNINSNVDKDYLYYLLSSNGLQNKFKSLSAGSGVQNLKKETVSAIKIKLPPPREQKIIANILIASDNEIVALEKKLSLLKEQRKYLLNNLVTGKIRTPEDLLGGDK